MDRFFRPDDQWFSTKLEKINKLIKTNKSEVFCNAELFKRDKKLKINIPDHMKKNFIKSY